MIKFLVALLVLTLFGCRKANDSEVQKGIANIGLVKQVETLDPANSYDLVSAQVVYQGYETLYEYHYLKRPYTLKPLLATDLPEVSNDGLTYTFNIKPNIQYHQDTCFKGEKRFVRSEDFIHQIKRVAFKPTKSNGWFLFDEKIKGINEFRDKASKISDIKDIAVEGLEVLTPLSFRIHLNRPYPQLKYAMAMAFTSPVPYEVIECYKNNLTENMVGTGPFELVQWNRGLNIEMKKFKDYRVDIYPSKGDRFSNANGLLLDAGKKIPFVDKINFKVIQETQSQWLNFLSKKVDFLPIPKDNYDAAITTTGELSPELEKRKVKLQVAPTLIYWWVGFNMKHDVLGKNKYLRYAIANAIDRKKFIKLFTNNVGQEANSIYPPGIPGYDPSSKLGYGFNMDKAREFLKKSGHPEGKGLPTFTFDVRGSSTMDRQMGEFIKSQLEKIGIKVKVVTNTFPGFLKKTRTGEMQIWLDGWALDYPDAENILQLLYTKAHAPGPNQTFYSNPKVDKLIERLMVIDDSEEKTAIMKAIEKLVINDMPWTMLYYKRNYILRHDHLKNFRKSELIHNYLKYIKIE